MNRRFEVYQYRQVLLYMRQGETDRSIAKAGLMGRRKSAQVRRIAQAAGWLDPQTSLPDDPILAETLLRQRDPKESASSVLPYAAEIQKWAEQGIQATTIFEALRREKGFSGHYSAVRRFVQKIRPAEARMTMILDFKPGEAAQVDFGAGPKLIDPKTGKTISTWFFLMTLAFSRHAYAEIVLRQDILTWQECHRRAFEFFGGRPEKLIIDNLKSGITKACIYDPEIQRSYEAFAEGYGFIIAPCPPADPEKKGRVESGVKYLKNSFLPLRTFTGLADSNRQLREWLLGEAGNRIHGTTKQKPLEVFTTIEKGFLKPLPDVPPETVEWAKGKLHRNNHVCFQKNWYSAPHGLVDQELWIRGGPRAVQIFQGSNLVATHPRLFGQGEHQTVNDHLSPNCRYFVEHTPEWCREEASKVGLSCLEVVERLLEHPRLECLRAVQRILRFRGVHGDELLEEACTHALGCDSLRAKTIGKILEQLRATQKAITSEFSLESAYQGLGRFCRQTFDKPVSDDLLKGDDQ